MKPLVFSLKDNLTKLSSTAKQPCKYACTQSKFSTCKKTATEPNSPNSPIFSQLGKFFKSKTNEILQFYIFKCPLMLWINDLVSEKESRGTSWYLWLQSGKSLELWAPNKEQSSLWLVQHFSGTWIWLSLEHKGKGPQSVIQLTKIAQKTLI